MPTGSPSLTVWVPSSPYPQMTYGSSPVSTTLTSQQIYNPATYCADSDTYTDQADPNVTREFFNTQLVNCSAVIRGGTILGAPNISYDSTTGRRTIAWTVQAPVLAASGTPAVFIDTFTWTDSAVQAIRDNVCVTNNTVIHHFVGPVEVGAGGEES